MELLISITFFVLVLLVLEVIALKYGKNDENFNNDDENNDPRWNWHSRS